MQNIQAMTSYGAEQAAVLLELMQTYAAEYFDEFTSDTYSNWTRIICTKGDSQFMIYIPNASGYYLEYHWFENGVQTYTASTNSGYGAAISNIIVTNKAICLILWSNNTNTAKYEYPLIIAKDTEGNTCTVHNGGSSMTGASSTQGQAFIAIRTMGAGYTGVTYYASSNTANKTVALPLTNYYSVLDGVYFVVQRPFASVINPFTLTVGGEAYCSVAYNYYLILDE